MASNHPAAPSQQALLLRSQTQALLSSPDRYESSALALLEKSLKSQVEEQWYDADANTALLRLFQSDPSLVKSDVLGAVLIKAMMQLRTLSSSFSLGGETN